VRTSESAARERETSDTRAWSSRRRIATWAVIVLGFAAALAPSVALLIEPDLTDPLGRFSYVGVFLVNLVSTATLFFPVPGITAAANVLIVTEGSDARFPWLVGVFGGTGMAIGELTAYYAGVAGSHAARMQIVTVPPRLRPAFERASRFVYALVHRWGMLTLFVLAAIPDPVFEVAAVGAGSAGMPLRRYFVAVLAGCLVRGVSLAYLGTQLPFLA
jgi:membrane protein DedA with SNARE-associated domain